MRRRFTIAATALAIALITMSGLRAQQPPRPTLLPVPFDGQPWRIERIADIPQSLKGAIEHTRCHIDEAFMHGLPIKIFRPGGTIPVIAIVPCESIVFYGRAFAFERDHNTEPKPMLFPAPAAPSGFGTTDVPGVLDWDATTKTLTATHGTDVGDGDETRHTYRYDRGQANWFTLIRIETRKCCRGIADGAWTPIWEAQPWPKLHL